MSPPFQEIPAQFAVGPCRVRGVLHRPAVDRSADRVGLVFLHGWGGCRLGPHRMFVHAARRAAALGHPSLRFDFRGRGESDGEAPATTIADMIEDTLEAVAFLLRAGPCRRVVLVGVCSGCKVALGAAPRSEAIVGLALWSPELPAPLRRRVPRVRRAVAAIRAYAFRLLRAQTWRRLFTGQIHVALARQAILRGDAVSPAEAAAERLLVENMATFRRPVLCVFGSGDPDTRQALDGYRDWCRRCSIPAQFVLIADADHNFTSVAWEQEVLTVTEQWLADHV